MVDVRGLRYSYAGSAEPALRGIDFTVDAGEVFRFLGPRVVGKSATQKILVGLLDDYDRQAAVFDRAVDE